MVLGFHRPLLLSRRRSFACCCFFLASSSRLSSAFLVIPPPTSTRSFASSSSTVSSAMSAHEKKQVLVPIANGSEEIETTCITDTLTRFGAQVTVASVHDNDSLVCTMSRGLKIMADCSIADTAIQTTMWDLIVLPGGMPGAEHLRDCTVLMELLRKQKATPGRWYGAMCAAPAVALSSQDLIDTHTPATCYPAPVFRDALAGRVVTDQAVVVAPEHNLITSQGPGTALLFGLALGEALYGREKRDAIAKEMLVQDE